MLNWLSVVLSSLALTLFCLTFYVVAFAIVLFLGLASLLTKLQICKFSYRPPAKRVQSQVSNSVCCWKRRQRINRHPVILQFVRLLLDGLSIHVLENLGGLGGGVTFRIYNLSFGFLDCGCKFML